MSQTNIVQRPKAKVKRRMQTARRTLLRKSIKGAIAPATHILESTPAPIETVAPPLAREDEHPDRYGVKNVQPWNTEAVATSCIMCNAWNAYVCRHCNSAHYCSSECQKADWPLHQLLCKELAALRDPPSETDSKIFVFRSKVAEPIVAYHSDGTDDEEWRNVTKESLTQMCFLYRDALRIRFNPVRGRPLNLGGSGVALLVVRPKGANEMAENQSLKFAARAAEVEPLYSEWRGAFTVLRELEGNRLGHVTMRDFRDVMDYLGWHRPNHEQEDAGSSNIITQSIAFFGAHLPAHGVAIACAGKARNQKLVEPVMIPERHPMRQGIGITSTVFTQLGFPVVLYKTGKRSGDKDITVDGTFSNKHAAALCMGLDPNSSTWGHIPKEDFDDAGVVFAVRADGAPLIDVQVERTIAWLGVKLAPRVLMSMRRQEGSLSPEEILRDANWGAVFDFAKVDLNYQMS